MKNMNLNLIQVVEPTSLDNIESCMTLSTPTVSINLGVRPRMTRPKFGTFPASSERTTEQRIAKIDVLMHRLQIRLDVLNEAQSALENATGRCVEEYETAQREGINCLQAASDLEAYLDMVKEHINPNMYFVREAKELIRESRSVAGQLNEIVSEF